MEIPVPKLDLDEGVMRTAEYYRDQFEADALTGPVMPSDGELVR